MNCPLFDRPPVENINRKTSSMSFLLEPLLGDVHDNLEKQQTPSRCCGVCGDWLPVEDDTTANSTAWLTVSQTLNPSSSLASPQHSPLIKIDIPATCCLRRGTRTSAVRRQDWRNAGVHCHFTSHSMILASKKPVLLANDHRNAFSCETDTLRPPQRSPVIPNIQV